MRRRSVGEAERASNQLPRDSSIELSPNSEHNSHPAHRLVAGQTPTHGWEIVVAVRATGDRLASANTTSRRSIQIKRHTFRSRRMVGFFARLRGRRTTAGPRGVTRDVPCGCWRRLAVRVKWFREIAAPEDRARAQSTIVSLDSSRMRSSSPRQLLRAAEVSDYPN